MPTKSIMSKKRRAPSSYTSQTRTAKVPKSDTKSFETKELVRHGIIMSGKEGKRFVSETSKELCRKMLEVRYDDPVYTQFPLSQFGFVLESLSTRNKYRVKRDLTPLLVPSPEHLFFCGHKELEHVVEEVSAYFTEAEPLVGPRPRPDFAVGIAEAAFTNEEIAKLESCLCPERPILFTDVMYFPFLICEVVSEDVPITKADRRCVRSSSMAVNAIIQLHRVLGDDQALKLSGQILVFSISHNDQFAVIHGHYATVEGDKVMFYRYLVRSVALASSAASSAWKETHDFVREIYAKFYPEHLGRIKNVLAQMNDPPPEQLRRIKDALAQMNDPPPAPSSESGTSVDEQQSQGLDSDDELALLREQSAAQRKVLMEELMAMQKKQYDEQLAMQKKQYDEQIEALKRRLDLQQGVS
ncbi:hypothetical protein A1O3_02981 [Capronia epimyces CBS 606.96]|uniref:DUF7924 domain-containing protein n=1 Tax=Capronia epimyces CBS 606.96 TaxID=1182542 RepID=W9Z603_9EURO|nr:uncharacterized protein A1O3_02981 [Capronia epimyces CBS 606.96]EXJ89914.1 hypothetical protein A1O3_02981 [Capronia epimyces CBS 606.96]